MNTFFVLTGLSLAAAQFAPQPERPAPIDIDAMYPAIPNEWIVKFHPEASDAQIASHYKALEGTDGNIMFKYDATKGFRGYAMRVESDEGAAMTFVKKQVSATHDALHEVHYFEQNGVVRAAGPRAQCNTQMQATWGLVRVGQSNAQGKAMIDGLYTYPEHGETDVKVYVLDTGIYRENVDFQGRAIFGADFTTETPIKSDLNGHGTHCAGTVMGKDYGVAKDITAVDVRVLGASGSGTKAQTIAGIDWTTADGKGKKAVGSLSLGGSFSQVQNDAINAAVDAGVTMVVAAGNSAMDACSFSPASATKAITVACSTNSDDFCSFSNYGSCTDIIAPGMSITSAWIGSKESDNTISGTSMSTPHVSGAIAHMLELSDKTLTPTEIRSQLMASAQNGVITNVVGSDTPNVLLQSICVGATNSSRIVV